MKYRYPSFLSRIYLRLLMAVLLSSPFSVAAQQETAFPNEYGEWDVGYYWMDVVPPGSPWSTEMVHYEAVPSPESDTIMLLYDDNFDWLGNYYSSGGKVYFKFVSQNGPLPFNADTGVYYLLYDFTLEVGDTAYLDIGPQYVTIDSITMEELNGDTLKHFYLSNSDIIVEKIGSLQGLFRPYERPFEIRQNLCSNFGSFLTAGLYTDYGYYMQDCLPSSVGLENHELTSLTAYPNPAGNLLHVTSAFPISTCRVYSTIGTLVQIPTKIQDNQLELAVSGLSTGSYLLELTGHNGISQTVYFMKD